MNGNYTYVYALLIMILVLILTNEAKIVIALINVRPYEAIYYEPVVKQV